MELLGIRKHLSKPLFQFPRKKNLIPKTFLFPAITVSGTAGYCNNNSCLLVSVDGFLLHSKSRGMQWKGQFWARQNTAYVILGKLFKSLSKKGSRQHLQRITSGSSLLLQCRWRAARLRKQSRKTGELSESSWERDQSYCREQKLDQMPVRSRLLPPAETESYGQVQKHRAGHPGNWNSEPLPSTSNTLFSNCSCFSIRWQLTALLRGSKFGIYMLKSSVCVPH